jgi:propane monooxygenase reductase component
LEKTKQYDNRVIDEKYLSEKIDNFSQYFYLCGPDPMVESIQRSLIKLSVDAKYIIVEQF